MSVTTQVEKTIQQEVAKFDPFEARIAELKEKYQGLTIIDAEDKENYELVRVAISELRSIRTGTEKDKKEIKAPFLAACSTIEEKAKWIISEVKKIEDPLQKRKDEIDEEREREKAEKKRRQDAALFNRQLQLTKMGAAFDGTNFILEGVEVNMTLVREVDDETYEEQILPQFKEIFEKNEAIRIAEEDKKKEADRILKEQQDELQRQQEAVKKQQEELERRQKEIEQKELDAKKKKEDDRVAQLYNMGMRINIHSGLYEFKDATISINDLKNMEDIEWVFATQCLYENIEKIKEHDRIEAEKKLEEQKKKAVQDALEKQKKEQEEAQAAKARQDELDRIRKEEELAVASDDVKWKSFLSLLPNGLGNLEFKSRKYRTKAAMAIEKLQEIKSL